MRAYRQGKHGGHAKGHLRDAFCEWVDEAMEQERGDPWPEVEIDGQRRSAIWLFGQLWNCTDCLPSYMRDAVNEMVSTPYSHEQPDIWTYAQACRHLKALVETEAQTDHQEGR